MRKNFKPTPEEHRRIVEAKRLGMKDKAIPLDSEIASFKDHPKRVHNGQVTIVSWKEAFLFDKSKSEVFTLNFSNKQSLRRLLNQLSEVLGENYVDEEVSKITVFFKEPIGKPELIDKLEKVFVKAQ